MYITKNTKPVKKLFDKIDKLDDNERLKILIYIINGVNNSLVNNKNIANPDLIDDEITIFTFEDIDMPSYFGFELNKYLMYLYNSTNKNNNAYEDNGHIIGIKYSNKENDILSYYEQFSFSKKLDILAKKIIDIKYELIKC